MTLQDIYDQLAYGELRNIVMGSGGIGNTEESIPEDKFEIILPFIALGLTELHKRFLLHENELTLDLVPGKGTYVITKDYAVSNTKSKQPVKYILDTDSPFESDLMRIERVYATYRDKEYEVPLNEIDNAMGVRSTASHLLQVPTDSTKAPWLLETTSLRVVYRANHPRISKHLAISSPAQVAVNLPDTHLEPLLWYVASRAHNPKGISNEFHEGNNYAGKFEASCQRLITENLQVQSHDEIDKFHDRGFC